MVKKKIEKPRRELTKRQLSRWQQQKRRQRITVGLGLFIIVVVLGIIVGGWYVTQYRPLRQTVIKVNDTEFDMNYYLKMLKFYGEGQSINYMYGLADGMVTIIGRNELVQQEAMKLGISVSNETVDEELKSYEPPLSKDYRDLVRADMLRSRLRDEYFEQKVPVSAEHRHIMAILLESENQATEVRARLENGENFADLAGELSLEGLSKIEKGDLGWRAEDVLAVLLNTSIPGEYAFSSEVEVLSQPMYDEVVTKGVGYWLIEVLDREEETGKVNVRVILLGSEGEAQEVRARSEAGEDFAALAQEVSQDYLSGSNGGNVGWVDTGILSPAFNEFVLEAELETLSEPVRDEMVSTTGGYWLLKVLGMDGNRKISDEDRVLLKTQALSDWILELENDPENKVESYLDDEKKAWAIEQAMKNN